MINNLNVSMEYPDSGTRKWLRKTLLGVLLYEGAGGVAGGCMLMAQPDGSLLKMPVEIMHGTFSDFFIPGIILFLMGVLTLIAFMWVLYRKPYDWLMSLIALAGFNIWFWLEIAILLDIHWLHLMWGLPVLLGTAVVVPLFPVLRSSYKSILLFCGIIASILYVVINIIVPFQWQEYRIASQTVSELSAIGAPTRNLWLVLSTPYTVLMIAFSWGVYITASNRFLRLSGIFLLIYALLGIFWPMAPMHLRTVIAAGGGTFTDTAHLALGVITEIIFLLALWYTAKAFGKKFKVYSLVTFAALIIFGVLTFMEAPGIDKNLPTPYIGIWERINIGVFLLWVAVLAIAQLRNEKKLLPNKSLILKMQYKSPPLLQ
jgi:hypothetical protein